MLVESGEHDSIAVVPRIDMQPIRVVLMCSLFAVTVATNGAAQTSTPSSGQASIPPAAESSGQSEQAEHPGPVVGTVDSVGRQTMVIRTDDNRYQLFVFEGPTVRPKGISQGARVRVLSSPSDESGVWLATRVTVLEPSAASASAGAQDVAPPPKELTGVQREIERSVKRWRLGARLGAGLDPELFLIGVQARIGPVFTRDFYLRPNVEFAFGELTDMFALNLEGAYRLPITFRHGRWSAYVGAGPGLNFIHQGVGTRDISFSNFNYETGFNIFSGIQFRRGTFGEVKTSLWANGVPTLRFIFGYNF